jgi:predicted Zn-dependent protease
VRLGRAFRTAILSLALATAPSAPALAQLPGLGNLMGKARTAKTAADALRPIGEQEEIALGQTLAGIILGAAPLDRNQAEQRYVNRVGRWLALHTERPNLPWQFGILDTPDVNAFSTPGGHVLITRGMFDRMRSESELAGVLAHEIAHVVQKHHLKALQRSLGQSALGEIGGQVYQPGGGIAGTVAARVVSSGKEMLARGLDKDDEYEADRMAVVIAARSGYSPYGLVGVLQTLSAAPQDGRFAMLFRTHPSAVDRIESLGATMGTRLDAIPALVDDLPRFTQIRTPPPPAPPPPKRGRGRN